MRDPDFMWRGVVGGVAVILTGGCNAGSEPDGLPFMPTSGVSTLSATGAPDPSSGSGDDGTGSQGTGGTSSNDTTVGPNDSSTGSSSAGSTSADSSTGGWPGDCPASEVVTLDEWGAAPWVVPDEGQGSPLQSFRLSTELWKHYGSFELDVDIDVTTVAAKNNCFLELRNVAASSNESFPWRYFTVCTRTDPGSSKVLMYFLYKGMGELDLEVSPFLLVGDTTYHVRVVYDPGQDNASLEIQEEGGAPVTITFSPVNSSIVPQGQGLDLLVGISETHNDVMNGNIDPPWGWTFRNLAVTMEPGGPFGVSPPPCE